MKLYFRVEFTIKGEIEIKEVNVQVNSKSNIKHILISEGQIDEIISINPLKNKPISYIG